MPISESNAEQLSSIVVTRQWIDPPTVVLDDRIVAECGSDPFLAGILMARGFRDPDRVRAFLDPDQYSPRVPEELPDLELASTVLQQAIMTQAKILVWGDFDVDGQTATSLLMDGLSRLGANVAFYIPNRNTESHGIRLESLKRQLAEHQPAVLLTCDTGVTEFDSIRYAVEQNLLVIITDHHELGETLPIAQAIVNPRRLPDQHPLSTLPGVGVAYLLMQHLFVSVGKARELPHLLDLVALGIVSDVALQTADTRYLLQLGLERLRETSRVGLQELMLVAGRTASRMTTEEIGFQIGPRLNAAGRLGDARVAVELLTTHDRARAAIIAQQLEGLNNDRRVLTHQIELSAIEMIEADPTLRSHYAALVLYQPNWHAGLVGIVANRLAEKYDCPVLLLTGTENGIARGSARGSGGMNITSAIAECADVVRSYGGHPGAAGVSLEVGRIDEFRRRLSNTFKERGVVRPIPILTVDAVVALDAITLDLAARIERLAPFGEGNPSVLLATFDVTLVNRAKIGRDDQHRKLTIQDHNGIAQTLLWWNSGEEPLPTGRFDVAFTASINNRGELELVLVDWREREPAIQAPPKRVRHWVDCRKEADPFSALNSILGASRSSPNSSPDSDPQAVIWAEGFDRKQFPAFKRRAELTAAESLIIFSLPSDPEALKKAVSKADPVQIYLFDASAPQLNTLSATMEQLIKAAHNVIEKHAGSIKLDVVCGAIAASQKVVRAGLEWAEVYGRSPAFTVERGMIKVSETSTPLITKDSASVKLNAAYEEMLAYRRYLRNTPLESLDIE